jgi:hypothetical protein
MAYWTGPDSETFVAEKDGWVIGTYYLRANQRGGGAHVANCGYVTADDARGRGVARSMCGDGAVVHVYRSTGPTVPTRNGI